MNRFSDEVRIIPGIAWAIALLLGGGFSALVMVVIIPKDQQARYWPGFGQVAFSISSGLLFVVFVLLIGYINADARRRGMRYVMWTLLAIFIPNTIGIILYFIFRDPLPVPCAKCGAQARTGFTFCPQCGNQLSTACPTCKRPTEPGWQRCAYCGTGLNPASPPPAMGTANR
jgi:hypothetical protein